MLKLTALMVFFVFSIATVYAADWDFRCVQDGLFPVPGYKCKKYFICMNTFTSFPLKKMFTCPPGLLFDQEIQSCN